MRITPRFEGRAVQRFSRSAGLPVFLLLAAVVASVMSAQEAAAPPANEEDKRERTGFLIRVSLPITGNVDNRIRNSVEQVLKRAERGGTRPVLIFELSPGQTAAGAGSEFERSLKLARLISSPKLRRVQTVAFIPKTIKGHAVLVAMACEAIVMNPEAEIGAAGIDEEVILPTTRSGYREIADARKTIPLAIALGMLDKELTVWKVVVGDQGGGTEFVLADELAELRKRKTIQSAEQLTPRPGLYSGSRARNELGFVTYVAEDRNELAKRLDLPASAVREDPSLSGDWQAMRVLIKGPINAQVASRVQRSIEQRVHSKEVNFVCVEIESGGGSPQASLSLATFLASLNVDEVRTVAYVPQEARGDAALIALGCDDLVMHPEAVIGGSGAYELKPDEIALAAKTYREVIATRKNRSWSLPIAMIDPQLKVYAYRNPTTNTVNYFSDKELEVQRDPKAWQRHGEDAITKPGGPLLLEGEQAAKLGVASDIVTTFDEFRQTYGLEDELTPVERGWADDLVDALANEYVCWLLLFIGGAAVLAELQSPGIGLGGFIAFLCFLVYFWGQFLHGNATWLEVMLFLAGVCCLLLEIFVIPGFGVFGLGGGIMIIASLILASQTFVIPHNDYQMDQLQTTMFTFAAAGVGTVIAAIVMRRYLPYTPLFNRMMLEPPQGEELEVLSNREAIVDFRHLIGQQGTTTTRLMPTGKARIGGQLMDVISDGELIAAGQEVVVVDARGNRVLVQLAPGRA